MADLIVLGGCVGVETAAKNAGFAVQVPFAPGLGDATVKETDAASFAVLEPEIDAFRDYNANSYQLVDRAHMLNLTSPEMTALVGGLRVAERERFRSQGQCPHRSRGAAPSVFEARG